MQHFIELQIDSLYKGKQVTTKTNNYNVINCLLKTLAFRINKQFSGMQLGCVHFQRKIKFNNKHNKWMPIL